MENALTLICFLLAAFILLAIGLFAAWDGHNRSRVERERWDTIKRARLAHRHYMEVQKSMEDQ